MPYVVQNPDMFTAAFSGALSGMGVSGRLINQDQSSDYDGLVLVAQAFAQSFDTAWGATAVKSLETEITFDACQSLWQDRYPEFVASSFEPSTYLPQVLAIIALIQRSLDLYTAEGYTNPSPTPSPTAVPFWTWCAQGASGTTATRYLNRAASETGVGLTIDVGEIVSSIDCTLTGLQCRWGNGGIVGDAQFLVTVNGVDTVITCTIPSGTPTASDVVNSVVINKGDRVCIKLIQAVATVATVARPTAALGCIPS